MTLKVGHKYEINDKKVVLIGYQDEVCKDLYHSSLLRMSFFACESFFFLCNEPMLRNYYKYVTAIVFDVKTSALRSLYYCGDLVDIKDLGVDKNFDSIWVKLCMTRPEICSDLRADKEIDAIPLGKHTQSDVFINFATQFDGKNTVTLYDDFKMTRQGKNLLATSKFLSCTMVFPFTKENVEKMAHLGSLNKPELRYIVEELKLQKKVKIKC